MHGRRLGCQRHEDAVLSLQRRCDRWDNKRSVVGDRRDGANLAAYFVAERLQRKAFARFAVSRASNRGGYEQRVRRYLGRVLTPLQPFLHFFCHSSEEPGSSDESHEIYVRSPPLTLVERMRDSSDKHRFVEGF